MRARRVEPSAAEAMAATGRAVDAFVRDHLTGSNAPDGGLFEAMQYAALGPGKRFRPALVMAAAELFGLPHQSALRVAAAIELVHTYSLVHDDLPCMDDDDLRRGRPTTHVKFGEATAVLVGDALLPLAFELLVHPETHSRAEVRIELVRGLAVASGAHGMVVGQMLDLAAEHRVLDLDGITRLQELKTGALITFACESPAVLAEASGGERAALRAFARDLGLAFQITDDILDVEGTAAAVGKGVGKDAGAGKATFVSLLGVEAARARADRLMEQAAAHLDCFGARAATLRALGRFVVQRSA